MSDKEDSRSKIVRIVMAAASEASNDGQGGDGAKPKPKTRRKRKPPAPSKNITVKGNANVVGDSNVIAMNPRVVQKTVVKTGDGVVSAEEKAVLKRLIDDWVKSRSSVRRSKTSYAAAWSAFNKAQKVNSYHELPASNFDRACAWLRRQIGIVGSMASAPRRLPGWRTKQIASIKARCKNQLDDEFAYAGYIAKTFGARSLTELGDDDLQRTYAYVFGKRV